VSNFTERIKRAAVLDAGLYEEVERDTSAMGQAVGVVLLASVAAGIGSVWHGGLLGLVGTAFWDIVGWLVWSLVIYFFGTRVFPEEGTEADYGQLLRTIGFAYAPGLIRILGIIPLLRWIVMPIAWIWVIAAMVVAVRQALDYRTTGKAILVCAVGFICYMLVMAIVTAFNCGAGF
jgi:hypothetical protein